MGIRIAGNGNYPVLRVRFRYLSVFSDTIRERIGTVRYPHGYGSVLLVSGNYPDPWYICTCARVQAFARARKFPQPQSPAPGVSASEDPALPCAASRPSAVKGRAGQGAPFLEVVSAKDRRLSSRSAALPKVL